MKDNIYQEIIEHEQVIITLASECIKEIDNAANLILDCLRKNGKIVIFGNGGSAADAQHLVAEFIGKLSKERQSIPAIALTTNSSSILALGNDYGFERIFERQIEGLVGKKDIVIGISTSGNSENVIRGVVKAKEIGAKTIAFIGATGGKLKDKVDLAIVVPSENTQRIQEVHILIGHIICRIVERSFLPKKTK